MPHHWIYRGGMGLTMKQQRLKGGVVPERLSKHPGPLVPDFVACECSPHARTDTVQGPREPREYQ